MNNNSLNEELKVKITADIEQAMKSFQNISKELGKVGESGTNSFEKLSKNLEATSKKMGDIGKNLSMKITAPMIAMGGSLMKIANDFDNGMKIIRAGTGATGEALDELGNSMRNVLKDVPESVEAVSQTMADLNTRTGLTGEALEEMTKKMLDLSRISGDDINSLVQSSTRLFGDWSIATEEQTEKLDYLWKVSQNTGIGVDQLNNKMVQFGAPLRQLGFEFEEIAVLFGDWEKNGVNAELVMGSMRQGLAYFAREGIEAKKGIRDVIEEIENLESGTEATARAMEVFGARAGADMAASIREGRFEIEDLIKTVNASEETIEAAAFETMTLGEQFAMIKNKAMIGMEPAGKILLSLAKEHLPQAIAGVEKFANWVQNLSDKFNELSPQQQSFILKAIGITAALGPVLIIGSKILSLFGGLVKTTASVGGAFAKLGGTLKVMPLLLNPVGLAIAGVATALGILFAKDVMKENKLMESVEDFKKGMESEVNEILSKGKELRDEFSSMGNDIEKSLSRMDFTLRAGSNVETDDMENTSGQLDNYASRLREELENQRMEEITGLQTTFQNMPDLYSKDEQERLLNEINSLYESKNNEVDVIMASYTSIFENAFNENRGLREDEIQDVQTFYDRLQEIGKTSIDDLQSESNILQEQAKREEGARRAAMLAEAVKIENEKVEELKKKKQEEYDETVKQALSLYEQGRITNQQKEDQINEAKRIYDLGISEELQAHYLKLNELKAIAEENVKNINWETGEFETDFDKRNRIIDEHLEYQKKLEQQPSSNPFQSIGQGLSNFTRPVADWASRPFMRNNIDDGRTFDDTGMYELDNSINALNNSMRSSEIKTNIEIEVKSDIEATANIINQQTRWQGALGGY